MQDPGWILAWGPKLMVSVYMCIYSHLSGTFHKDKCKIAEDPPRTQKNPEQVQGPES